MSLVDTRKGNKNMASLFTGYPGVLDGLPRTSSLSERTKVWGRALIVSPISATRWGAGRLRIPTTRPRWEKKRRFAFSPTGC